MVETLATVLNEFNEYTPEEEGLLRDFANILPAMYMASLTPEQEADVNLRHLEVVEKCINAGLARPISRLRDQFLEKLRIGYQMYDGG